MQVWQQEAMLWFEDDNICFYVAEDESQLIGYISVKIMNGPIGLRPKQLGKIIDIGLDLHQAHRKLGGQLVNVARTWLQERHIRILTVDLPARYPVEDAFWRGIGAKLRFNEFWMAI